MQILILSRNNLLYSTQSLLRACARNGHQARVIDHMNCDLVIEADGLHVSYHGMKLDQYDALIPRVGSSVTAYGANVIRHFELMNVFSVTGADAMLQTRNKWHCYQLLASHGIPVPVSILPNYTQMDHELIKQHLDEPLIVKLLESTHGLGVVLSEKYINAISMIEAFYRSQEGVLLQEFIQESRGVDIRALVVDNKIVASMRREARGGDFRSNLHRGATAVAEKLTREEADLAKRVCRIMGLEVAGVDILRSNRGPLILEVNASPGLEGIEKVTGVDVSGAIIKFIEKMIEKRNRKAQLKISEN